MTAYAVVSVIRPPAPALPAVPVQPALRGAGGCTGRKADGGVCNANGGDDGRCARHKEG